MKIDAPLHFRLHSKAKQSEAPLPVGDTRWMCNWQHVWCVTDGWTERLRLSLSNTINLNGHWIGPKIASIMKISCFFRHFYCISSFFYELFFFRFGLVRFGISFLFFVFLMKFPFVVIVVHFGLLLLSHFLSFFFGYPFDLNSSKLTYQLNWTAYPLKYPINYLFNDNTFNCLIQRQNEYNESKEMGSVPCERASCLASYIHFHLYYIFRVARINSFQNLGKKERPFLCFMLTLVLFLSLQRISNEFLLFFSTVFFSLQ